MRIALDEHVAGVSAATAFAWWCDFAEDDHAHVHGLRRHVIVEGAAARMQDELRIGPVLFWRERTRAQAKDARPDQPARVEFDGENPLARFSGSYAFEPHADGVNVRLVAGVHPKGLLARFEAVGRPLVVAILRHDLRRHARDMRKDMTRR